ncbi:MAG: hypothetical protein P3W94_007685 [Paracoccus sp. (in: a-proteobacteria)]|nr:hypothetical protein [Paracoccus sp. (in: a-proteobacteria)]
MAEKVRTLYAERGINTHLRHRLTGIEPGQKRAIFEATSVDPVTRAETKSKVEMDYD